MLQHHNQTCYSTCKQGVHRQQRTVILADRCNATFGYCRNMSSVCRRRFVCRL